MLLSEVWQANAHGRYTHPSDPNPAPLDPNFEGAAVLTTDAEERYRFTTIKPAAYPAGPISCDQRTSISK
jgi:protocatechuate 3,4-dioxygenase beta subunit